LTERYRSRTTLPEANQQVRVTLRLTLAEVAVFKRLADAWEWSDSKAASYLVSEGLAVHGLVAARRDPNGRFMAAWVEKGEVE